MNFRIPFSWFDIRDSLWYRPAIMTVIGILLSFVTIGLDHALFTEGRVEAWWLFEGGVEGARGVLTAIASTTMTVATTAFSFTLVALQLASSQYSPRIVRNFTGDRTNQLVIGIFVSTFVYSLLVLRVVRSEYEDSQDRFVPAISVSVAVTLAMVCIAALIFFFHHATRTIQASVIITRTTEQAAHVVDATRKRMVDEAWRVSDTPFDRPPRLRPVGLVRGEDTGYVQKIRLDRIASLAREHNVLVEVNMRPGHFLLPEEPRLTIWAYPEEPAVDRQRDDDEQDKAEENNGENGPVVDAFDGLIDLGLERTLETDILFGLQQVTDIAHRAMSSGINDPNTAIDTLDRIGELLIHMRPASGVEVAMVDEDGVMRILHPGVSWEEMVNTAFMQLRHYAAGDIGVAVAMIRITGRLRAHVPPQCRPALETVARDMAHTTLGRLEIESDRKLIRHELATLGLAPH